MKNNNSKKFNLYTQGQRLAARVLLVVWLLGISSPQRALAGGTSPSLWNVSEVIVLGVLLASVGAEGNPLVRCLIEKDGTCSAPSRRSLNGYRNTEYNKEDLEKIFKELSSEQQGWVRKKIERLKRRQRLQYIDALSRALQILGALPQSENSADLPPPTPADNQEQVGDDESVSVRIPAVPVPVPVAPASEELSEDAPPADREQNLQNIGGSAYYIHHAWIALQIGQDIIEQDSSWEAIIPDIENAEESVKIIGEQANNLWATVSKNPNIANGNGYEKVTDREKDIIAQGIRNEFVGVKFEDDWLRVSYTVLSAKDRLERAQNSLDDLESVSIQKQDFEDALGKLEDILPQARRLEQARGDVFAYFDVDDDD